MYKVVIADDELKICQLIQILVDWEAKGLEIAGVAHNGTDALELVQTHQADIIITDIRMPELNGLDLVEALRSARPEISCVIISGYQEFEYARRALQYGVEEYLLKPIREEELNRVLDEIIRKKDTLQQEAAEKLQMEQVSSEQKEKMHALLVRNTAEGNPSLRRLSRAEIEQAYYCSLPGDCMLLFGIKLNVGRRHSDQESVRYLLHQWLRVTQKLLSERLFPFGGCEIAGGVLYGLINFDVPQREETAALIRDIERAWMRTEFYDPACAYTIGISGIHREENPLLTLGEEVRQALLGRFAEEHAASRITFSPGSFSGSINDVISVPVQNRIIDAAEHQNDTVLRETAEELEQILGSLRDPDGAFVFSVWEEFLSLVLLGYKHLFSDRERAEEREAAHGLLDAAPGRRELKACVLQVLQTLASRAERRLEERSSKPIEDAKRYVAAHYQESCSLDEISEMVGLNASYFSSLFKKEEQMGFVEYVTKIRMQRARELLMDRERKVLEIAQAVGYQDEKYFSRAFRKTVGLSPSEYRKIYC